MEMHRHKDVKTVPLNVRLVYRLIPAVNVQVTVLPFHLIAFVKQGIMMILIAPIVQNAVICARNVNCHPLNALSVPAIEILFFQVLVNAHRKL